MDAKLKAVNPSAAPAKPIPNLPDWNRNWGSPSTSDRSTYQLNTKHGEYHLSPVADKNGRFVGHHLQFAHTGEGKRKGPGMWHDLGLHTHPGMAVAAARKHHDEFSKNESLRESMSPSTINRIIESVIRLTSR